MRFSLEDKFGCKLGLAGKAAPEDLPKRGTGLDIVVRLVKVGMVEHIEKFSPDLDFCAFRNREILERTEIHVLVLGTDQVIPALGAKSVRNGVERGWV